MCFGSAGMIRTTRTIAKSMKCTRMPILLTSLENGSGFGHTLGIYSIMIGLSWDNVSSPFPNINVCEAVN